MTLLARLLPLVLVLLSAVTPARALDIDVDTFTLDNGMKVLVIPDRRAPVVTHMVWYKVGSADEPQGKAGIAHMLEHLMFKGTPKYPDGAFSRILRQNGAEENAFTTKDVTVYHQRVVKDRLPLVMELEADRMHNLALTDEKVLPERAVVMEERRARTDNEPGGLLAEQIDAALFTAHPYGKPIIGWMAEVAELTRQDALDFYADHYEPQNAILVVAGDVTAEEVKTLAERHYGPLKNRRPVAERRRSAEPAPNAERRVIMRDQRASTPTWQRHYLTSSARNLPQREELALSLLAHALGGGSQSRMHKRLTLEKKLAAYAGAWFSGDTLDYGEFGLYAAPNPGVGLEALEAEIDALLEEFATKGITAEELRIGREATIASATYILDSQESLARYFGNALATGQTIEDVMNWERDIAQVTVEDVNEAARKVLQRKASVTGILLPEAVQVQ